MSISRIPISDEGQLALKTIREVLSQVPSSENLGLTERRDALLAFASRQPEIPGVEVRAETIGGVPVERLIPPNPNGRLLFVHGGAFVAGSAATHRGMAARLALAAGAEAISIDYRLAPEHPYPSALQDVMAVWNALAAEPTSTAFIGDSAGGCLVLAALIAARDQNLRLPAAALFISPWVDLRLNAASHSDRAGVETMLTRPGLALDAKRYTNGLDPADPKISPLLAGLANLPPCLIQVGDHEILLDDAVALYEKLQVCGVTAELEIWDRMIHAWPAFALLPEAGLATERAATFLKSYLRS